MGYWGIGWLMGGFLIGVGVLAAIAAIVLAIVSALNPTGASAGGLRDAATPMALGGLALIVAGASLRWCGSSCGDDCCDWDDGQAPNATLTTGTH